MCRVCVLLEQERPGFRLTQQRWDNHLRPGHQLLELQFIKPTQETRDQAKLLQVTPTAHWPQEWLDALHFIEDGGA